MDNLFYGDRVRLAADEPQALGSAFSKWSRNSEYRRLMDSAPPQPWSTMNVKEWFEKGLEKETPGEFFFTIHTLETDQLIGFVALRNVQWSQREAWVGIGIGEPAFWGKGYGTEAMHLALRYAFMELSLERVSLSVLASNRRAIRSYEKTGFKIEGLERQTVHRDGGTVDLIYMGLLRREYLAQHGEGEGHES